MTIVHVQREFQGMPKPPVVVSDDDRKSLDAAIRALPMSRLVGNGMDYSDAAELHRLARAGVSWIDAAALLGENNLLRARQAEASGYISSASASYRYAAACFRFGQSTLYFDDNTKRALYKQALDAFTAGSALDHPRTEKIEIDVGDAILSGWLLRPAAVSKFPVVMIFGGADGWREEYHSGAKYLIERGLGAFLVDGPGQGETRILREHYLRAPSERAYAGVADFLAARSFVTSVGIWGNSLGGTFAARTAAICPTIAACCVNGGAATPIEVLDRFPRFIDRICAMMGQRDHERARALMTELAVDKQAGGIRCPLLVIHGGEDRIFSLANGLSIYENALSRDKSAVVWDDGDHCIYNRSHEKHSRIADWFATILSASSMGAASVEHHIKG
ncbi:MAG: hypothetical protein J0I16_26780 [Rhizobiales bacterium]|nr:hypothetical protein [Hyphomicrobiales bacterium]